MTLTNQLAHEKSPYLLQHAANPVAWQPWGDAAFATARAENKPVFLSIGYSTCHWCHVMAHESFEDAEAAALINRIFVPIKVDREERPDIDGVYMTACQMLTGSGGWPLTVILTPDRQPFFAGTYIPKETRYGRLGLLDLLPRIEEVWKSRPDDVLTAARQIQDALSSTAGKSAETPVDASTLDLAYEQLAARFDHSHGGFGESPKFPTPHNLVFLLRYWQRTGKAAALEMVTQTLTAMRRGGIFDHLGFGFHRYATDEGWLVPHFEKMLYDQALLGLACVEAYQATGNEEYSGTAREIFTYVLRDLRDELGGFFSAEDADSDGEDGKFYLWTEAEIRTALDGPDAALASRAYNVRPEGNYTDPLATDSGNNNILHLTESSETIAADLKIPEADLITRLEKIRGELWRQRTGRVPPFKDDKVLTDWNGLMIAALAKGARVLGEAAYAEAAKAAADFILGNLLTPAGRLEHRYRDGHASIEGNLDDYAFLVFGLTELYQATFEPDYLRHASELNDTMIKHFRDPETGGFYFTPDDAEALIVRQQEVYDGALPSGNSMVMLNLITLARLTGKPELEELAAAIPRAFSGRLAESPAAYTQLLVALNFLLAPSREVVIVGPTGTEGTQAMLRAVNRVYQPNLVLLFKPAGTDAARIEALAPFVSNYTASEGRATAYICRNQSCQLPVTEAAAIPELLAR
jgi:uncharacterized protein